MQPDNFHVYRCLHQQGTHYSSIVFDIRLMCSFNYQRPSRFTEKIRQRMLSAHLLGQFVRMWWRREDACLGLFLCKVPGCALVCIKIKVKVLVKCPIGHMVDKTIVHYVRYTCKQPCTTHLSPGNAEKTTVFLHLQLQA
eukprot:GHRR01026636.1.p1 GENE.GHRR01026636.1~~GHRR01026636.1.p1  ORF type:complete len:139 (+),score=2.60 GHRR01026636.1:83-499(+)